jgi:hypothetical protein
VCLSAPRSSSFEYPLLLDFERNKITEKSKPCYHLGRPSDDLGEDAPRDPVKLENRRGEKTGVWRLSEVLGLSVAQILLTVNVQVLP